MPVIARRTVTVAASSLLLAALSPSALATPDAARAEACGSDEVTVVVDYNELGGPTRTECVTGPGTAQRLFDEAGFTLATANAPGMEGFVCRVDGRPAKGPCTRGDAYWSLWWADGEEWVYASLGVRDLELEPGSYLGFAWHQGDDKVAAPDLEISSDGTLTPEDDETAVAAPAGEADDDGDDGAPVWLLAGGAAVVLGAAGVVPLLRRRAREP